MKKSLVILLVLTVLITACSYQFNVPGFNRDQRPTGKGVGLQFNNLERLKQVFEGEEFQIDLTLFNYNSNPVSGNIVATDGLDDEKFGGVSVLEQAFSIEGYDETLTKPPSQNMVLTSSPYRLNDFEKLTSTITVAVTYDYDFQIQPQICFKKKDEKIPGALNCNPFSLSGTQLGRTNSLSPVTVSKIDIQTSDTKEGMIVSLALHIQNSGGGLINNEKATLTDLSVNLGGRTFNCKPTTVSLKDNQEGLASCNLKVSISEGQFINDPLKISFKFPYRYVASIDNIEIKKAL